MRHPIQPLDLDAHGVLRFKENKIVRYLLDNGGIDLNRLAVLEFEREEREQFAQLIGYSLSGFGQLGYVSDATYCLAQSMYDDEEANQKDELIEHLQEQLIELRKAMATPVAMLFGFHPDDLEGRAP